MTEKFPDQAFADDDDSRIAALDLDFSLLFGRRVSRSAPARRPAPRKPRLKSILLAAAVENEAEVVQLLIEAERRVWANEPAVHLIERVRRLELLAQVSRDAAATTI